MSDRNNFGLEGQPSAGNAGAASASGKRLGDVDAVSTRCGWGKRTTYRYADRGLMPYGIRIGGLRRWDLDEIDRWISGGCKAVRPVKGGAR